MHAHMAAFVTSRAWNVRRAGQVEGFLFLFSWRLELLARAKLQCQIQRRNQTFISGVRAVFSPSFCPFYFLFRSERSLKFLPFPVSFPAAKWPLKSAFLVYLEPRGRELITANVVLFLLNKSKNSSKCGCFRVYSMLSCSRLLNSV